ncbi:hypothetical protein ACP4OV_019599 [Aristida adscensionis]
MQSEEVRSRFGRCPYCRAMIYPDPSAVIYYCSRCRTPIRGKNPRPADETEYALSQLEILSADTASVFSDESEPSIPRPAWAVGGGADEPPPPPPRSRSTPDRSFRPNSWHDTGASSSAPLYRPRSGGDGRTEAEGNGSPLRGRVTELRPSSRRTRRSASGDVDAPSGGGSGTDSDSDVPASASALPHRRRASPLSSQELDASAAFAGLDPAAVARSPLNDPAFQQGLLQALDNLRRLIAAVDQPRTMAGHWHTGSPGTSAPRDDDGAQMVTRRSSRLMRRLESQLAQALPAERPCRGGSTSSSSSCSSSASSSRRGGLRPRTHHCRPVLGGTPFVVCDKCSEVLQLPAAMPLGRAARLQCGGCGEALALTLPASGGEAKRPKKIFSAPQPAVCGAEDGEDYAVSKRSSLSGEQPRPAGPLHRVLGYSSVSSVLRSRRYGESA